MGEMTNLKELIQTMINCCSIACDVIEFASRKFILKYKDGDDPVTHIDHTIQKTIVSRLENQFPGLPIVAEEDLNQSMVDSSRIKIEERHTKIVFPFQNELSPDRQFKTTELCVFIDPLDCTRGFITGRKWECTILIGITYQGKPIAGVIGQPYFRTDQTEFVFMPRIIVGTSISKDHCYFHYYGGNIHYWEKVLRTPKDDDKKIVAISSRRASEEQKKILQSFQNEEIRCGGSGNKLAMLIRGEVDVTMFIKAPTSTWDSCAGEAIILGMGGYFIKPDLSQIKYVKESQSQLNREGFICTFEEEVFLKIKTVLEQIQW